MIRFLTILCLSVVCVNLSFACDFSSDEQTNLITLKLRATHFFEEGKREQERLTRIEILKIQQNFENLRLAVQSCIVCENFKAGESLLSDYYPYITPYEVKILRDYIQHEKVKDEERLLNNRIQRQRTVLGKILLTLKFLRKLDN